MIVNEKYLEDYYNKRNQLNKLQDEVSEMSKEIKDWLERRRTPLGATVGKYICSVNKKYKLNQKFIEKLKKDGITDKIHEIVYIKDVTDIVKDFTEEDFKKYYDEWYKQLVVRRKK